MQVRLRVLWSRATCGIRTGVGGRGSGVGGRGSGVGGRGSGVGGRGSGVVPYPEWKNCTSTRIKQREAQPCAVVENAGAAERRAAAHRCVRSERPPAHRWIVGTGIHNRMGRICIATQYKNRVRSVALLQRSVICTFEYTLAHLLPTFGLQGGRVGRYLPTYAHLHGRTDTQTCKRTINARTRRHKMYAKDIQNNIDITRIVSEIKSNYRGDARTRTPTNYNLSEQTEFVITCMHVCSYVRELYACMHACTYACMSVCYVRSSLVVRRALGRALPFSGPGPNARLGPYPCVRPLYSR